MSDPATTGLPEARAREVLAQQYDNDGLPMQGKRVRQNDLTPAERRGVAAMLAFVKEATPPANDAAVSAGETVVALANRLWNEFYDRKVDPKNTLRELIAAIRLLAAAPKVASDVLTEEWLADVLQDSLEMDWTSSDGARAIMQALKNGLVELPQRGGQIAHDCWSSPDGRHQVDTSMEEGPNNCFHCSAKMGTNDAR